MATHLTTLADDMIQCRIDGAHGSTFHIHMRDALEFCEVLTRHLSDHPGVRTPVARPLQRRSIAEMLAAAHAAQHSPGAVASQSELHELRERVDQLADQLHGYAVSLAFVMQRDAQHG